MPTLRNINPLGEIDLPLIGRSLKAGETFDVTDDQAAALLEQVGNYEAAPEPTVAVSDPAQEG